MWEVQFACQMVRHRGQHFSSSRLSVPAVFQSPVAESCHFLFSPCRTFFPNRGLDFVTAHPSSPSKGVSSKAVDGKVQELSVMSGEFPNRILRQVAAWTGLLALCGVLALAQDAAPGARSDGQIEMDVVHALDAAQALKNDMITAATIEGEVTLSGTVALESSKQLAQSIARQVPGVVKVKNNLKVGDPKAAAEQANLPAAQSTSDDPTQGGYESDGQAQSYPQDQSGYNQAQQNQQYPQQDSGYQQGYNQPAAPYAPPAPPVPQRPRLQVPNYPQAPGPLTIAAGTLLELRTAEAVSSKFAKDGTPVQFTVLRDVVLGGNYLAIPRGATVHGVVTQAKKSGALGGAPELSLKLTALDLGGRSYPLDSDEFKIKGPNKAGSTAGHMFGGALIGTIIGCAAGRGAGCAIGAGAGAAAGGVASAATSGPDAWIPSEARVDFHIASPVTVNPVSHEEAVRLAEGLVQGGPILYQRQIVTYPYGPYGAPVVVAAPPPPPVYYHPYYVVGGYYYWR